MYTYTRFLAAAALLGACVADGDASLPIEAEVHAAALQQDPPASDVAAEAAALYEELAARLEARGYTAADALAAAEAGDEARARELFGYTDAEYEAIGARLIAIADAVEEIERGGDWSEPETAEDPDGLRCDWGGGFACAYSMTLGSLGLRGIGAGWPLVAAVAVGAFGSCAWAFCDWERDGRDTSPGTRTKPK